MRIINDKLNKMNESVIIQKLIQVGQMLERGELEYSGAEIDTKHYLEQYVALSQPHVSGSLPLQTKLEMFYDFLYERGIAKQLGIGIDTIVKHFIDEKLSDNDR